MANYGAIPTSSHPTPVVDLEFISRAKLRIGTGLAMRRPWRSMFDFESLTFPHGLFDAMSRIKTNVDYFRANYVIGVLFILFVGLIYHPKSLLVLTVLVLFWIFLYFFRDEALVVSNYEIGDRMVFIVLSVMTVVFLLFTHATPNIIGSLFTSAVLIMIHGSVRRTDNLFLDDEEAVAAATVATQATKPVTKSRPHPSS